MELRTQEAGHVHKWSFHPAWQPLPCVFYDTCLLVILPLDSCSLGSQVARLFKGTCAPCLNKVCVRDTAGAEQGKHLHM